jgi:anti-anti-sigma factor
LNYLSTIYTPETSRAVAWCVSKDEPERTFGIVSETGESTCVNKLQGDIDLRAVPRLRGALRYALDGSPVRLIVDLTDASPVDVTAIAVLAAASHMAQDIGTPLLLQVSNPDTVNLLALAGLDRSSRRRRAHARRPSTPAFPTK